MERDTHSLLIDLAFMAYGQPTPADRRSIGIAMALEAARARHRRFCVWLRDALRSAASDEAAKYLSPEAAMMASAFVRCHTFVAMGGHWENRAWAHGDVTLTLAEDLMGIGRWRERGPDEEWLSLPWQHGPVGA